MTELQTYKGKNVGDTIKFESDVCPAIKTGKIMKIFRQFNEVYLEVKIRGGSTINIPATALKFDDSEKLCTCEMSLLMRAGCQCGGK